MDKELSLIKECPNDECEHFNGHSKMCYSCGWIEARQHYTQAREIFRKVDKILKNDELCCLAGRCNYNKLQALKAEYGVQEDNNAT